MSSPRGVVDVAPIVACRSGSNKDVKVATLVIIPCPTCLSLCSRRPLIWPPTNFRFLRSSKIGPWCSWISGMDGTMSCTPTSISPCAFEEGTIKVLIGLDRFLCHDFHDVGRCEECPGGYDWKSIRSWCLKLSSRLLSNVGGRILGVMNALLHMLFYSMVVGQCSRPNHTCDAWELSDRCFAAAAPASGSSSPGGLHFWWCPSST
jgi:hypothetical protein